MFLFSQFLSLVCVWSIYLSVCVSAPCLSVCLSVCPSVCLSVHLLHDSSNHNDTAYALTFSISSASFSFDMLGFFIFSSLFGVPGFAAFSVLFSFPSLTFSLDLSKLFLFLSLSFLVLSFFFFVSFKNKIKLRENNTTKQYNKIYASTFWKTLNLKGSGGGVGSSFHREGPSLKWHPSSLASYLNLWEDHQVTQSTKENCFDKNAPR